jgi:hypothetical protein
MKQLRQSKATASVAGLFFIVEKNATTLCNDIATTEKRATTRGEHGLRAFHTTIPTTRESIELKRLLYSASTLLPFSISIS